MAAGADIRGATRQLRRYHTVGAGCTQVQVDLEEATLAANLVLADLDPPLLAVSNGLVLEGPGGSYPVTRRARGAGFRYMLEHEPSSDVGNWRWRYSVAPGLHANYREASFCQRDERGPILVCDHTLRIPCQTLELQLELASRIDTAISFVDGVDGAPASELGPERYELSISDDRTSIRLCVRKPVLGRRYGVRYWFFSPPDEGVADVASASAAILRAISHHRVAGTEGVARIEAALNRAINVALSKGAEQSEAYSVLGPGSSWRLMLWDAARAELVTCVASSQPAGEPSCYGLGEGMAGQCLRTWQPTGYVKALASARSLYIADPQGGDDDWRFCIPLTLGAEQSPIGVVLLRGHGYRTEATRKLEELARIFDVLSNGVRVLHGTVHHLFWMVNANFWAALAELDSLETSMQRRAHDFAASYKNLGTPILPATEQRELPAPSRSSTTEPPASVPRPASAVDRSTPGLGTPSSRPEPLAQDPAGNIRVARIAAAATIAAAVIGAAAVVVSSRNTSEPRAAVLETGVIPNRPRRPSPKVEHVKAVLAGASAVLRAQLAHVDLSGEVLDALDFRAADLRDARLPGASLVSCDLTYADLRGVNLAGADLRGARLAGACYDHRTIFPDGFLPGPHGLLPAVHDVVARSEARTVTISWQPATEWMLVRVYDAEGSCISPGTCAKDSSEVRQSPLTTPLPPGAVRVALFRRGAPYEEAATPIARP